MIRKYTQIVICCISFIGLCAFSPYASSQESMTREERIKALERLKMEDEKIEANTIGLITKNAPIEIEKLELPPLSVFLDAVVENATVKRAQSQVDKLRLNTVRKRSWWNYFRLNGMYSYGRYNVIGTGQ